MAKKKKKTKSTQEFARGVKEGFNQSVGKILEKPRAYTQKQIAQGAKMKTDAEKYSYESGKAFGKGNISKGIDQGFKSLGKHIRGWFTSGWGKVLKGVFNDPEWYKYHGWETKLAFNTRRPMDPVSLKAIAGQLPTAPLNGVTHVIHQNLVYSEVKDTEAFKLATIEAFRSIRLDLKSNLLYTQEQYDNYVAWVLAIAVKAYAIERTLGMVNKTRPDIPEFQDAIGTVTGNYSEFGKLSPVPIAMISSEQYATSLAEYKKLQSVIQMVQIPEKLNQFAKWWVGGLFIDQAAPNPQIYVNMLRKAPIYSTTDDGDLVLKSDWDIATGSVSEVVSECIQLLTRFGVLNADIEKTHRYGRISLEDIEQYEPHIYVDYEFFSVLINSYQQSSDTLNMKEVINPEYLRVDFMNELSEANTVGVCNALAPWSGTEVPLRIVSQAAYFTADASMRSTRNVNDSVVLQDTVTGANAYVMSSAPMFIQVIGCMDIYNRFGYAQETDVISSVFTPSVKFGGQSSMTPTTMTLTTNTSWVYAGLLSSVAIGKIIGSYKDNQTTKFVLLGIDANNDVAKYYYGCTSQNLSTAAGSVEIQGATVTRTTDHRGNAIYKITVANGSSTTIPDVAYTDFLKVFTVGSDIFVDWLSSLSCTYVANSDKTLSYEIFDSLTLATFVEQVDYHLPMYVRQFWRFTDVTTGQKMVVNGLYHLLKECYIPTIVSKADVKSVLYWMYLGLFSIEAKSTSNNQ
jgi:hypothetical protein